MKIVIEIEDYDREWIANGYHIPDEINSKIVDAIIIGTPLPKGHGDLVDRNCIRKAIYAEEDNLTGSGMTYDEMDFYNEGIDSMWNKLQNADPIIKADKEE